ncbi:hypothetical protein KAF25_007395 [Fusarium avenaceum]|uniref:RING-type domain-containing protein n=1 Tax=Fusarium avenaceum TaxID=40199 RepID=A0A9P7H5R9_9HYPO|nr:hypothetical protein KAF25_007395 [Fusarium avenaceum]
MCIKVIRWFFCPVIAPDPLPQVIPRPYPADPFKPWIHWQPEEPVPPEQLQYLHTAYQGYYHVRHRREHWIRCARIEVNDCLAQPVEIRTELYNIACPSCTGDHDSAMSAEPFVTHSDETNYDINDPASMRPVHQYLEEIMLLVRAFFKMEVRRDALDEVSWTQFLRGLNCTHDPTHIQRDHPDRVGNDDCLQNCPCSFDPGAHNLARAARNHEAHSMRTRNPRHWFVMCAVDKKLVEWKTQRFAHLPNQLALNRDDQMVQRHDYMMGRLNEQLSALLHLEYNPDLATSKTPFIQNLDEWRRRVRAREATCVMLVRYAANDPGINLKFAESIMKIILPALAPGFDSNDPRVANLFCNTPAQEGGSLLDLVEFSDQLYPNLLLSRLRYLCMRHQLNLFEVLVRNRRITSTNILGRQRVAQSVISTNTIPGSDLLRTGEVADQNCTICGDDFDTKASACSVIPHHLAVMQLPCCRQFIHARCFKGIAALQRQACPFCNADLATMGMVSNAHNDLFSYQRPHEDLPRGLHRFPDPNEQLQAALGHPGDIRIIRRLNRVTEAEEGLRPGYLGHTYRDWPLPPLPVPADDDQGNDGDNQGNNGNNQGNAGNN